MENKVFKCLHPRLVRNKYTGEMFQAGCGVCKACLERMANNASYKCSLHELDYKYCMFVTLTYRPKDIPLMRLFDGEAYITDSLDFQPDQRFVYDCIDVSKRAVFPEFGTNVGDAVCSSFEFQQLLSKLKYYNYDAGDIPYLSRRDAQNFLKRFRKHLSKFTNEKISYYLVGEYGPVHFRPHFHINFYFNDEKTLEVFGEVLRKSWTFGFIDYSLSRGKTNSYVAKYVNCRNSIPRIYSHRSLRPFCLHSQNFALGFYKSQKEKIYENVDGTFDAIVRVVNGKNAPTLSWRSLVSCFFPKCRRFNSLALPEITYSYLLLQTCSKLYNKTKVSDLVEAICFDLYNSSRLSIDDFSCYSHYGKGTREYLLYFIDKFILSIREKWDTYLSQRHGVFAYRNLPYDYWKQYVKPCIASMLYTSKHFQTFVCDDDLSKEHVDLMISKILKFYQCADYRRLVNQYLQQESMNITTFNVADYLPYLYDNVFPTYEFNGVRYYAVHDELYSYKLLNSLPLYRLFVEQVNTQWQFSVKHKVLNDQNDIFCQKI